MKYVNYLLFIFLELKLGEERRWGWSRVWLKPGGAEAGWGLCIGSYLTDADSEEHHSQLWVNLGFWAGHGRCAPLSAGHIWVKQDLDRKFAFMIDSFFMSCEIYNWCTWIQIFFFFTSIEVTAVCASLCLQAISRGSSCSSWVWSWDQVLCQRAGAHWARGYECHPEINSEERKPNVTAHVHSRCSYLHCFFGELPKRSIFWENIPSIPDYKKPSLNS